MYNSFGYYIELRWNRQSTVNANCKKQYLNSLLFTRKWMESKVLWNSACKIKLLRLILMYKCTRSTLGYQLELVLRKINWNSDVENSVNKLWNRWPLNSEIIATAKGPSFFFFFFFCAMAHNGEVWSTPFNPLTTGRRGGLNKSRPVSRCLSICLPLTHIFIWISS